MPARFNWASILSAQNLDHFTFFYFKLKNVICFIAGDKPWTSTRFGMLSALLIISAQAQSRVNHTLTMKMFLSPFKRIDDINIAELPPLYKIDRFYIPSQSDIYFEPRTNSNRTLNTKGIFNGTKCGVPKEHCFSIFLWRHYDVITWKKGILIVN